MANGRVQAFGPKDEVLAKVLRSAPAPLKGRCRHGERCPCMSKDKNALRIITQIRRYLVAGVATCLLLVGGVGGWAALTEMSGAVIALGPAGGRFQRQEGPASDRRRGRRDLVREGDRVKAGDILVRLDETVTRANLAIVIKESG